MDKQKVESLLRELLSAMGEDASRKNILNTPKKAAELLERALSGIKIDTDPILQSTHEVMHDDMVIVKDIAFYSICEHHLVPFFGKIHIGYIPKDNRIAGIGRIADLVGAMSRRLQLQESLTTQIADSMMKNLGPKGVGVVIEARHLCHEMMGMSMPGSSVITSSVKGIFRSDIKTREEFLNLIR